VKKNTKLAERNGHFHYVISAHNSVSTSSVLWLTFFKLLYGNKFKDIIFKGDVSDWFYGSTHKLNGYLTLHVLQY